MRPLRLALPLCLLLGPAEFAAHAQPIPSPPAPPIVPPAPPRPPSPPAPAEAREAGAAARRTERLIRERRLDEAIANYRQAIAQALGPEPNLTWAVHSLHVLVLANRLIWNGRIDEADTLLAEHLEHGRASGRRPNDFDRDILDHRLYIAAGRGRIPEVLALIERRVALARPNEGACPLRSPFPEVVAPTHHVAEVAAKLRLIGCGDEIIEQLDRLASRPLGQGRALSLPARAPAPSAASAE